MLAGGGSLKPSSSARHEAVEWDEKEVFAFLRTAYDVGLWEPSPVVRLADRARRDRDRLFGSNSNDNARKGGRGSATAASGDAGGAGGRYGGRATISKAMLNEPHNLGPGGEGGGGGGGSGEGGGGGDDDDDDDDDESSFFLFRLLGWLLPRWLVPASRLGRLLFLFGLAAAAFCFVQHRQRKLAAASYKKDDDCDRRIKRKVFY